MSRHIAGPGTRWRPWSHRKIIFGRNPGHGPVYGASTGIDHFGNLEQAGDFKHVERTHDVESCIGMRIFQDQLAHHPHRMDNAVDFPLMATEHIGQARKIEYVALDERDPF